MKQWREVPDYEGLYKVSNMGEVYSYRSDKLLKPDINRYGYGSVTLYSDKPKMRTSIHRLVTKVFIGESGLVVNHLNGIKMDNRLENLEYCTVSENNVHALKTGLLSYVKLKPIQVNEIRRAYAKGNVTQKALGEMYGVKERTVCSIVNNERWKHLCCPICSNDSWKCICDIAVPGENSVSEI